MSGEEPTNAGTRNIEASVEIDASAEAVWQAITDGDAVANWFAPIASAEPGEGGQLTVSWGAGAAWTSRITVWEPNRHLRLADELPEEAADQGAAMVLDYHLGSRNGKTLVTVVNSGLSADPSWGDTVHMMTNGWRFFLWNLKHYLERHPDARRTMISERPWVTGTREEVWETIFGKRGMGRVPVASGDGTPAPGGGAPASDGPTPLPESMSRADGPPFRLALDEGTVLEGTVILCDRPWAFAGMVSSLDDGVLHVEMEGTGERWKMGVWLSVYGLEEERCKRIGMALGQTLARLFPGEE